MKKFITVLIIVLVSTLVTHADTYQVNASSLNVRDMTSQNSSVIGKLTKGETVEVLSVDDGWATIEYGDGQGYVKASFLIQANNGETSVSPVGSDGPIHRFLSIFSNDGEEAWFSIVKWILIVIFGIVILRYGLSLLAHMLGFGVALGGTGLAIGALLYWFDWVKENTIWDMGTYGFYAGCVLALLYLLFNFREWRDDANSILKRSSTISGAGTDDLQRYTVHDDYGIPYHLTQDSKYSESNYTDQNGNKWVRDNSGFRRI